MRFGSQKNKKISGSIFSSACSKYDRVYKTLVKKFKKNGIIPLNLDTAKGFFGKGGCSHILASALGTSRGSDFQRMHGEVHEAWGSTKIELITGKIAKAVALAIGDIKTQVALIDSILKNIKDNFGEDYEVILLRFDNLKLEIAGQVVVLDAGILYAVSPFLIPLSIVSPGAVLAIEAAAIITLALADVIADFFASKKFDEQNGSGTAKKFKRLVKDIENAKKRIKTCIREIKNFDSELAEISNKQEDFLKKVKEQAKIYLSAKKKNNKDFKKMVDLDFKKMEFAESIIDELFIPEKSDEDEEMKENVDEIQTVVNKFEQEIN